MTELITSDGAYSTKVWSSARKTELLTRQLWNAVQITTLMAWPSREGWLHGLKFLLVQGGAEGTDERVLGLQVTSVNEGHDVERVTETCGTT